MIGVIGRRIAIVAVMVAACEPESASVDEQPEPVDPPAAWRTIGEVQHWLPGPASSRTQPDPNRAELDHECRSCHPDAAHEWQQSQHASAWSSDAFTQAFASEPRPFCQGCHAPETSPREPVPSWAAELGVGCVTCHVENVEPGDPRVWSGLEPTRDDSPAPHPIARSAAFDGPQACAGCHEFEFPDRALRDRPLAMQATLTEHAASSAHERSCVDCHMPIDAAGRRSHAFPGAYDPIMLRRALAIEVHRPAPDILRIELRPGEVGHAVPTGDLLRRLEVALVEVDERGRERVHDREWLARRFGDRPQSNHVLVREQIADERVGVGEGPRVVELRVPAEHTGTLRWRITHQRVAEHARAPRFARVEGSIEIVSGPLP